MKFATAIDAVEGRSDVAPTGRGVRNGGGELRTRIYCQRVGCDGHAGSNGADEIYKVYELIGTDVAVRTYRAHKAALVEIVDGCGGAHGVVTRVDRGASRE